MCNFSLVFTPRTPPNAEHSTIIIAFNSVMMVRVSLYTQKPAITSAINTMAPFATPSSNPWRLLILAATYPPNSAPMASTASIIYARYSYGKSDETNSITVTTHNSTEIIATDDTTPSINDLTNVVSVVAVFENERKKITSDTLVFRGDYF